MMVYQPLLDLLGQLEHRWTYQCAVQGDFPLSPPVINALPDGAASIQTKLHGISNIWYLTGSIELIDTFGKTQRFFIKYGVGTLGRKLILGEYHAMTQIRKLLPSAIPDPLAAGPLDPSLKPEGWFFLATFITFDSRPLPSPQQAARLVAKLHLASMGHNHSFGSPIPMFDGIFCHVQGFDESWPRLFSKMLWQAYKADCLANGHVHEIESLIRSTVIYTVPWLLSRLKTSNGAIQPCFIHGDLWEGNFGTDLQNGRLFMFDSNGFYAHNEMELAYWRTQHHRMHEDIYCEEYLNIVPASEPTAQFDDRLTLYGVKACLMYSANGGNDTIRYRAMKDMRYLLQKHAILCPVATGDISLLTSFPGWGFSSAEVQEDGILKILKELSGVEAGNDSSARLQDL